MKNMTVAVPSGHLSACIAHGVPNAADEQHPSRKSRGKARPTFTQCRNPDRMQHTTRSPCGSKQPQDRHRLSHDCGSCISGPSHEQHTARSGLQLQLPMTQLRLTPPNCQAGCFAAQPLTALCIQLAYSLIMLCCDRFPVQDDRICRTSDPCCGQRVM